MTKKNDALLDDGLRAVMGCHIRDEVPPVPQKNPIRPAPKLCQEKESAGVEAQWEPVKEPVWTDKFKDTVKKISVFAVVCLWLFYLQQSKLMDSDTAYQAMIVCNLLAGLSIGKAIYQSK